MIDIEKKRLELEYRRVEMAKMELEFKLLELEKDKERIKGIIEIQDKKLEELKEKLS